MKLNRKWLNEEFVDLSGVPDREFVETMTIAGQKVETYERLDAGLRNVVVGRVVSITRHTNSDHMWVCQIDVGAGEPVQIVTGAQNVHEGDLVPVAQHNSWLPGGVHITKGKLRGEVSNGMLCSLKELGLTLNDFPYAIEDGIWILQEDCKPGDDINTVIGNDDTVVDFEITNNRPDCYSILGLAREAAAAFNKPMRHHDPVVRGGAAGELSELLEVEVPAEDLCRRYTARMVRNVKIAPSPKWLRQRLRANGVRPINNIVDITNYVMLEYGQPMHAFDYRYVGSGKIIVRRSEPGEVLTTLDGNVRTLTPGMLVIADETKPIGLAGIMGGENSEIMDDTVDVVFESANFNGTSGDVDVVTHEAGHALNAYLIADNRFALELGCGGMETAETHSMSMEFFAWPYLDAFFPKAGDAERYRFQHALDALSFLPYGTMVDEFQHRVYADPDLTPAERNAVWLELEAKYRPYIDQSGIPYLERGTRWQYQMHIYETPFYYIDYCLAQTAAFQFLLASQDDYDDAFARYLHLSQQGGEKLWTDLLAEAGFRSPFEPGALAQLAARVEPLIRKHTV